MSFPIIRLEVERMKHTMVAALTEYHTRIDSDLQAAVESFCSPDNLKGIIDAMVEKELKTVIEEEVRNFFRYGKGRGVIRDAVVKKLEPEIAHE